MACCAVDLAIGSVVAAKGVPLEHAVNVLPLGTAMGFVVLAMVWGIDWRLAVLMLMLILIFALSSNVNIALLQFVT